jgi:hypothetical protein
MLPRPTDDDLIDELKCEPEAPRNLGCATPGHAEPLYLFGGVGGDPLRSGAPTLLGDGIRYVFFLSTEKQVVWVYAGPHVALVENGRASGDWAPVYLPGVTVRL